MAAMHSPAARAAAVPLLLVGAVALLRQSLACDSSYTFPNVTEAGKPVPANDPLVRMEASLQWQSFPRNGSV